MELPIDVRLARTFDKVRLKHDLEIALDHFKTGSQSGPYHDGSWKGISLRSIDGSYKNSIAFIEGGFYQDTLVLDFCPYFKEILDSLPFRINIARLLFLPPDKKIGEHKDGAFSWKKGFVRLHIPIITHGDVIMNISGKRCQWKEGEFWFGDFNQPHHLHNQSDTTRVHLVMDCMVDDTLLELFPKEIINKIEEKTSITRHKKPIQLRKDEWDNFDGYFKLPKTLTPIPLYGKITTSNDTLSASIFGSPLPLGFLPVAENRFKYMDNELTFNEPSNGEKTITLKNGKLEKETIIPLKSTLSVFEKTYVFCQKIALSALTGLAFNTMKLIQTWKRVTKSV